MGAPRKWLPEIGARKIGICVFTHSYRSRFAEFQRGMSPRTSASGPLSRRRGGVGPAAKHVLSAFRVSRSLGNYAAFLIDCKCRIIIGVLRLSTNSEGIYTRFARRPARRTFSAALPTIGSPAVALHCLQLLSDDANIGRPIQRPNHSGTRRAVAGLRHAASPTPGRRLRAFSRGNCRGRGRIRKLARPGAGWPGRAGHFPGTMRIPAVT